MPVPVCGKITFAFGLCMRECVCVCVFMSFLNVEQ